MSKQRVIVGVVVVLFVAQAVVVIGWPYVRKGREARAREQRKARRTAQAGAIYEAVARHWIEQESARSQGRLTRFVVAAHPYEQTDPLVARLVKEGYDVSSHPPARTLPSDGPMLNLLNIMWNSVAEVTVMGSAESLPGEGQGKDIREYRLRLEHGAWRVVEEKGRSEPEVGPAGKRAAQADAVYEAVIRYWIGANFATGRDRGDTFFVSIEGGDPSEVLLRRFAQEKYRVRKLPLPGATGQRGWSLGLNEIVWRGDSEAEVGGQTMQRFGKGGPVSGYGMRFILRLEHGRWRVIRGGRTWIT